MNVLRVFVPGIPVSQGSKDAIPLTAGRGPNRRFTGRVNLVESAKALPAWRGKIVEACLNGRNEPRARFEKGVPVRVVCVFVMPRPTRLRKTGPTPPHTSVPDGDKLLRAVCDALKNAKVLHDDAQIVEHESRKRYAAPGERCGAHIDVWHFTGTYPEEYL